MGRQEEEMAAYRQAIELNPEDAEAHKRLGNALWQQEKDEEAIAEYREVVRLKPDDAEAHFNLGMALDPQGKTEEEMAEYREAIRLDPNHVWALVNLASLLDVLIMRKEARGYWVRAEKLEKSPEWVERIKKRLAKPKEAIREYREAIRLNPDDAEALENLAVTLDGKGERKEARTLWERAEKLEKRPAWCGRIKQRLVEPD